MSISKFDKSIFNGNHYLSFLKFREDFEIDFNSNNVIFAFNGLCKTTISNFLANNYPDQFFLINYEGCKDSIKAVKSNKKIEIFPDVVSLQKAQSEFERVAEQIGLFDRIEKGFGIKKSSINNQIEYLKNAKRGTIPHISLTKDEYSEIDNLLQPIKKTFGAHFHQLINEIHDVNKEIENMQEGIVKEFCNKYLAHLQNGEDHDVCPICSNPVDKGIRSLLKDKINRLSEVVEPYFDEYLVQNDANYNSDYLLKLSELIAKYKNDEDKLCEYLLLNNFEEVETLNALITEQANKQNILNVETAHLESIAEGIHDSEPFIRDLFVEHLQFKEVKYDENKKGLVLTPDNRPVSSYSQGELNVITLMIRLTIARSTDKTNIIIDDPLSSYDLPNQYRIMYEIIKYIENNTEKKVIIFTHNSDALNIVKQYDVRRMFSYFYIEKHKGELSLEKLRIARNVIEIDDIIKLHDSEGFLEANRDRDFPKLIREKNITKDDLNKLFHYNGTISSCIYNGKELSNKTLLDKIAYYNPSTLCNNDFISNTISKVLYLMGIRVYVEKMMFDISEEVAEGLSDAKTFGAKLDIIETKFKEQTKNKYPNINIDSLKIMKTMLNQNDHYKSQVQPYYYAMNISLDELDEEIQKLRAFFS